MSTNQAKNLMPTNSGTKQSVYEKIFMLLRISVSSRLTQKVTISAMQIPFHGIYYLKFLKYSECWNTRQIIISSDENI